MEILNGELFLMLIYVYINNFYLYYVKQKYQNEYIGDLKYNVYFGINFILKVRKYFLFKFVFVKYECKL